MQRFSIGIFCFHSIGDFGMKEISIGPNSGLHFFVNGIFFGEILHFRQMSNPKRLVLKLTGTDFKHFDILEADENYKTVRSKLLNYISKPHFDS